jgi:hypothetical protein
MAPNSIKKIDGKKLVTMAAATFAVFAMTYFAMAENKGANVFLDSDQDGLTDQEEKALGTNPNVADTDGDGYSDGAEIKSGYNPLKPAPGDRLIPTAKSSSVATKAETTGASENTTENKLAGNDSGTATGDTSSLFGQSLDQLSALTDQDTLPSDIVNDLSSDPENPNLTNEVLGNFLQLTLDKSQNSQDFADNPSYSQDDYSQIIQNSLATVDITKDLPEIRDDEMKVLPPVDDKKLSDKEVKEEEEKEIEKYLSSIAFIFASNSPFPVSEPNNLQSSLNSETENLVGALAAGNQEKIDDYAQKARTSIEQIKKVEIPYVMKDIHKSTLQLAIYTLDFKNELAINPTDPMKSLAAFGALQSVGESVLKLQEEFSSVLNEYGISSVELKK